MHLFCDGQGRIMGLEQINGQKAWGNGVRIMEEFQEFERSERW